jgi:hypothetical protein
LDRSLSRGEIIEILDGIIHLASGLRTSSVTPPVFSAGSAVRELICPRAIEQINTTITDLKYAVLNFFMPFSFWVVQ